MSWKNRPGNDSLIRLLRDPGVSTEGKGDACLKLMQLGSAAKPAVPALLALLEEKDPLLRDFAATTLGKIQAGGFRDTVARAAARI